VKRLNKRGILALVVLVLILIAAVEAGNGWFALASYIGEVIVVNSAANPVNTTLAKLPAITKYVWFDKVIPGSGDTGKLTSPKQSFTGYGKIHVLIAINLTAPTASVTFWAYAYLYNSAKTKFYAVAVDSSIVLSGTGINTVRTASAWYYLPGPDLYFAVEGTPGTKVSLMVSATIA